MVIRYLKKNRVSLNLKKFLRFQMTAILATAIDFLITIFLKEQFQMHYPLAVAGGAFSGAFTAFSLNRYWVFHSFEKQLLGQGLRYLLVATGSILLNTGGTFLLTESFNFSYIVSKAVIAILIGFTYSFYFSKRFVFYA